LDPGPRVNCAVDLPLSGAFIEKENHYLDVIIIGIRAERYSYFLSGVRAKIEVLSPDHDAGFFLKYILPTLNAQSAGNVSRSKRIAVIYEILFAHFMVTNLFL
jgi:hypothetical protein